MEFDFKIHDILKEEDKDNIHNIHNYGKHTNLNIMVPFLYSNRYLCQRMNCITRNKCLFINVVHLPIAFEILIRTFTIHNFSIWYPNNTFFNASRIFFHPAPIATFEWNQHPTNSTFKNTMFAHHVHILADWETLNHPKFRNFSNI